MNESPLTWEENEQWILKQAETVVGCVSMHLRTMYGSFFRGIITCYAASTPYYSSSWDSIFFDTIEEAKLETERLIRSRQLQVRGFINQAYQDEGGRMYVKPYSPQFG